MPFASKAQRAYLAIHHPEVAHEFAEKIPEHAKLPEHVKKMAEGGYSCMYCGGIVEEDGSTSTPHDVETEAFEEGEPIQFELQEKLLANALKKRKG